LGWVKMPRPPRTDAALTRIDAAVAVFCGGSAAQRLFLSALYI
jgi:hypothetical protein